MKIADIKYLVNQKNIPADIQGSVVNKALQFINDEKEVEAIVSTTSIVLDVYDERGMIVDKIRTTFTPIKEESIN